MFTKKFSLIMQYHLSVYNYAKYALALTVNNLQYHRKDHSNYAYFISFFCAPAPSLKTLIFL
jgi:hypothetical protein